MRLVPRFLGEEYESIIVLCFFSYSIWNCQTKNYIKLQSKTYIKMFAIVLVTCKCERMSKTRLEIGGPFLEHENKGGYSFINEDKLQELSEKDRKKLYFETATGCLDCGLLFSTREKNLDECICPKCNNAGTNIMIYDVEIESGQVCPSCLQDTLEFEMAMRFHENNAIIESEIIYITPKWD